MQCALRLKGNPSRSHVTVSGEAGARSKRALISGLSGKHDWRRRDFLSLSYHEILWEMTSSTACDGCWPTWIKKLVFDLFFSLNHKVADFRSHDNLNSSVMWIFPLLNFPRARDTIKAVMCNHCNVASRERHLDGRENIVDSWAGRREMIIIIIMIKAIVQFLTSSFMGNTSIDISAEHFFGPGHRLPRWMPRSSSPRHIRDFHQFNWLENGLRKTWWSEAEIKLYSTKRNKNLQQSSKSI